MVANSPQEALQYLREKNFHGLGTVRMTTLLYFISKGECPIYDKYVSIAVKAIKSGKKPGDEVGYTALPEKTEVKAFAKVYECHIDPFADAVKEMFEIKNFKDRKYDHALWVYGHAFVCTNSKARC